MLQLSKIPRSGNNNYNHYNNIQRSITSYSPKLQSIENSITVNDIVRKNNNDIAHGLDHHQGRYYSSTTYKNFSSQPQQEQSFFDSMKSKLSFGGSSSTKKESDEAAQFKRLAAMESKFCVIYIYV